MNDDKKKVIINTASGIAMAIISLTGLAALYLENGWSTHSVWLLTGWLAVCAWLAGTIVYVNGQKEEKDKIKATVLMDASFALAIGMLGISFWQHKTAGAWAIALLWAAACLVIGGIAGFLFGLPSPASSTSNSNEAPIKQIADWLTKIIVGLTLTKLGKIPGYLDRWAAYVVEGIGKGEASNSAALALILYFTALGFIGGCVLTNLFLEDLIKLIKEPQTKSA